MAGSNGYGHSKLIGCCMLRLITARHNLYTSFVRDRGLYERAQALHRTEKEMDWEPRSPRDHLRVQKDERTVEQLYNGSFHLHFNSELTLAVAFRALQSARWTWPEQIELGELRNKHVPLRGHANLLTSQNCTANAK